MSAGNGAPQTPLTYQQVATEALEQMRSDLQSVEGISPRVHAEVTRVLREEERAARRTRSSEQSAAVIDAYLRGDVDAAVRLMASADPVTQHRVLALMEKLESIGGRPKVEIEIEYPADEEDPPPAALESAREVEGSSG